MSTEAEQGSILVSCDDDGEPVCLVYGSGADIEADGVKLRRYVPAVDAQALADVRTLDDWAAARSHYQWGLERYRDTWRVKVQYSGGTQLFDIGATPDEARAKAAAWVREQVKP